MIDLNFLLMTNVFHRYELKIIMYLSLNQINYLVEVNNWQLFIYQTNPEVSRQVFCCPLWYKMSPEPILQNRNHLYYSHLIGMLWFSSILKRFKVSKKSKIAELNFHMWETFRPERNLSEKQILNVLADVLVAYFCVLIIISVRFWNF